MSRSIRDATPADADGLARLLTGCLRESYAGHPGTPLAVLRDEVLAGHTSQRILLAETRGDVIGFVAWDPVYDMHWASRGAQVADLYVAPRARGLGVALELITGVCGVVAAGGGVFLRGGAYDRPDTRRFYSRFAIVHPGSGETNLGARAFRRMAALAGEPARVIARALPSPDWNLSN
jgi:GNAT superfamily N-acetyltransferase